jgi:hypothetical protein
MPREVRRSVDDGLSAFYPHDFTTMVCCFVSGEAEVILDTVSFSYDAVAEESLLYPIVVLC